MSVHQHTDCPPRRVWTLTNRRRREIACTVASERPGTFTVIVELEGNPILYEPRYTDVQALERAARLRTLMADWEHTS